LLLLPCCLWLILFTYVSVHHLTQLNYSVFTTHMVGQRLLASAFYLAILFCFMYDKIDLRYDLL
jgi:hypothetical protein